MGDPFDLFDLVDEALDDEDGDLLSFVVIDDDGGFDASVPGEYSVVFSVTDSADVTVYATAIVTVLPLDSEEPTVTPEPTDTVEPTWPTDPIYTPRPEDPPKRTDPPRVVTVPEKANPKTGDPIAPLIGGLGSIVLAGAVAFSSRRRRAR